MAYKNIYEEVELPEGFPSECRDKVLRATVKNINLKLVKIGQETSASLIKMSHRAQLSALMQLGLSEIQGRQTNRLFWLSTFISFSSLAVALFALYISTSSSSAWQQSQIDLLNKINSSITDSSKAQIEEFSNEIRKVSSSIDRTTDKLIVKSKIVNKSIQPTPPAAAD